MKIRARRHRRFQPFVSLSLLVFVFILPSVAQSVPPPPPPPPLPAQMSRPMPSSPAVPTPTEQPVPTPTPNTVQVITGTVDYLRSVSVLNNEALDLMQKGELQEALAKYKHGLVLLDHHRDVADRKIALLNNIGLLYAKLGQNRQALQSYQQAMSLLDTRPNSRTKARTLNNLGLLYANWHRPNEALKYYKTSLALKRSFADPEEQAITLNNIALVYASLHENTTAAAYYERALARTSDTVSKLEILNNLGLTQITLNEPQRALASYRQALVLIKLVSDPVLQGDVLDSVMQYWQSAGNRPLAILFGKEAVNCYQQVRSDIARLDFSFQQGFSRSKEETYRRLAGLLITEKRYPEALRVLDLLKVERFSEYTHHRGSDEGPTKPITYTHEERELMAQGEPIDSDIIAVANEWNELKQIGRSRSDAEQQRFRDLTSKLQAANVRMGDYLRNIADSGVKQNAAMPVDQDEMTPANRMLGNLAGATDDLQRLIAQYPGTVALYTLLLPQKYVVIVITPNAMEPQEVVISADQVRDRVIDFVSLFHAKSAPAENEVREKGKKLYEILIRPIEDDLRLAHASTLLWSLDDVLAYVPVSALYDGHQYLVQRFRNVVITPYRNGLTEKPNIAAMKGLAMGVSKAAGNLPALTAVRQELRTVVHGSDPQSNGPIPGEILLDGDFTLSKMEEALASDHPSVLHIASHYVLVSGDDTASYLLLGAADAGVPDNRLTLKQLETDPNLNLSGVDLLTLAGCQTGTVSYADGREVDSLGMAAEKRNAKSVIATLWEVDDPSAAALVGKFYELWIKDLLPKAEALRQAQLALLNATVTPEAESSSVASRRTSYSNPYYWGPFILIGNWN